jgi:hypothetical protein
MLLPIESEKLKTKKSSLSWVIVIVILFGTPEFWSQIHAAEQLNNSHLKVLLQRIHEKTGMQIPKTNESGFPQVVFVTQQFISGMVCKKNSCNAQAAAKDNIIFLVNGLDVTTIEGESILYHELIHILQFYNFGATSTCDSWVQREIEAYQLQDEFVTDKGYDMPWLRSVTHYLSQMCPK